MSVLDRILKDKRVEVERRKRSISPSAMKKLVSLLPRKKPVFLAALKKKDIAVIAEIKRRSPSKGLICRDFDPVRIARRYRSGGAAALSVLTDAKYFGGSDAILREVRKVSPLPILRKDFTIDEYQIYEARVIGADAVLLIVRSLSKAQLRRFYALATKLGLDSLFEVHDEKDLKKIATLKPRLVGVNNRDLSNFRTDLAVTERLSAKRPKGSLLVSESGIATALDVQRLKKCGAGALLVGESLMREKDPASALKRLLGNRHDSR